MGTLIEDVDASVAARLVAAEHEATERILSARRKAKKLCGATRWGGHLDPQLASAAETNGDITINVRLVDGGNVVSLTGQWRLRFVIGDASRALGGGVPYTFRVAGGDAPWPLVAVDNAQSAGQRTIRPVVELADLADIIVRS